MLGYIGREKGFTLTEIIIVITILGIIFTLVMITLSQRVNLVETRAKLSAAKSLISQAIVKYQAENLCNGNLSMCDEFTVGIPNTEVIYDAIFKDKFKIQRNCGLLIGKGCFGAGEYKKSDGEAYINPDMTEEYYKVLLQNGMSFAIDVPTPKCQEDMCAKIIIDTNGPEGPNVLNIDTYEATITKTLVKFDIDN